MTIETKILDRCAPKAKTELRKVINNPNWQTEIDNLVYKSKKKKQQEEYQHYLSMQLKRRLREAQVGN